jgi:hypothetical protein
MDLLNHNSRRPRHGISRNCILHLALARWLRPLPPTLVPLRKLRCFLCSGGEFLAVSEGR